MEQLKSNRFKIAVNCQYNVSSVFIIQLQLFASLLLPWEPKSHLKVYFFLYLLSNFQFVILNEERTYIYKAKPHSFNNCLYCCRYCGLFHDWFIGKVIRQMIMEKSNKTSWLEYSSNNCKSRAIELTDLIRQKMTN